jgi:hypothetical protein
MLKPLYFLIGTPLLVLGADWGLKSMVDAMPTHWSDEAQMATVAIGAVLFFAALTAIAEPPQLLRKKASRSKR